MKNHHSNGASLHFPQEEEKKRTLSITAARESYGNSYAFCQQLLATLL
jgi:hypothetical protein